MNLRQLLVASAASLTLVFASSGAVFGQAKYPSKNIEIVVPYAPRSCRKFISKFLRCEEGDLQARYIATRVRTTLAAGTRTPAR